MFLDSKNQGFQQQQPVVQNQAHTHGQKYGGHGQPTTAVITQPGAVPMVVTPVPHQDWTVPAVLACLCCFWPIGICAIISASKANSAAARGNVEEALTESNNARQLVILSVVFGIIGTALVVALNLHNKGII